jgi:hypothetical protein
LALVGLVKQSVLVVMEPILYLAPLLQRGAVAVLIETQDLLVLMVVLAVVALVGLLRVQLAALEIRQVSLRLKVITAGMALAI